MRLRPATSRSSRTWDSLSFAPRAHALSIQQSLELSPSPGLLKQTTHSYDVQIELAGELRDRSRPLASTFHSPIKHQATWIGWLLTVECLNGHPIRSSLTESPRDPTTPTQILPPEFSSAYEMVIKILTLGENDTRSGSHSHQGSCWGSDTPDDASYGLSAFNLYVSFDDPTNRPSWTLLYDLLWSSWKYFLIHRLNLCIYEGLN